MNVTQRFSGMETPVATGVGHGLGMSVSTSGPWPTHAPGYVSDPHPEGKLAPMGAPARPTMPSGDEGLTPSTEIREDVIKPRRIEPGGPGGFHPAVEDYFRSGGVSAAKQAEFHRALSGRQFAPRGPGGPSEPPSGTRLPSGPSGGPTLPPAAVAGELPTGMTISWAPEAMELFSKI